MLSPHGSCCCEECVQSRRIAVMNRHPLHKDRGQDPAPCLIPIPQALAMRLEEKEELVERLAALDQEIKVLRDCSQEVV